MQTDQQAGQEAPGNSPGDAHLSARLRAAGLKATAPRIAVLDLLQRGGHPDAEGVYAAVRERLGSSSLQAVYGVLAALCEAGLAKKIEPAGSTARFEARTGDNHHHLICSDCGRIEDVDCAVGEAPCMSPVTDHGFSVHTAEVTYWGICPACQAARTTG